MTPKREIGIEAAPLGYKDIIDRQLVRDARLSLRAPPVVKAEGS